MEIKKFAWLPKRVTSGRQIWLDFYWEHISLYDETTGRPPLNSFDFRWTETVVERTWRLLKEYQVHNRNVWNEYKLTKQDKI